MAFSLVACDAGPSVEKDGASTRPQDSTAAPSDAEVFFPTIPEQDALPTALTRGELALDGKGWLRITRNADFGTQDLVPIWPSTFEPDTSGGEVLKLDGERVVAQVGKAVEGGGGETSAKVLRGNDLVGERELRELSERCPDYY